MSTRVANRLENVGDETKAAVVMAAIGAVVVGIVTETRGGVGGLGVEPYGALVGVPTRQAGWLMLFVLSAVFTAAFVALLAATVNTFVNQVIAMSSRSDTLRTVLVPLIQWSALTVTATNMGLIFGVLLSVVFYVLVRPAWLIYVMGYSGDLVAVTAVGVVAWVLFGVFEGFLYGAFMEA